MTTEVITLWILIVLAHCVSNHSTGLTKTIPSTKGETTITPSLPLTFALYTSKTSSSTFESSTFKPPVSFRTERLTLPFVFNTVRDTRQTPQIATTTSSEPPHIVEQGLVQFMPPRMTIGPLNTRQEIVNKSISNKKEGESSRLNKDSLVYGNKMFANPVYSYVFPTVLGICLLTTIIFMLMLGKRLVTASSQMSKASCLLLIAVAVADVLTIMSALAEISWLFSQTNSNNMFLLPGSCRIMLILERLSAIPHAASTWFTVILAIQRYMCVSKPFSAGRHITIKLSCVYILTVSVLILGLHICRFFDQTFITVNVQISTSLRNVTIGTCQSRYAYWVKDPVMYESLFAWLRIALTQFSPCIFIVCFVYLLIRALRNTTHMTKGMQIADSKMSSHRRQLSLFVILVAFIVFCIEMPLGIFLCFNAWELSTGQEVFSYQSLKTASIALDLILYVSYFIIFMLYCLMSRDFRKNIFKTLIQTISE